MHKKLSALNYTQMQKSNVNNWRLSRHKDRQLKLTKRLKKKDLRQRKKLLPLTQATH